MVNSKLEKIIFAVAWFIILIGLKIIFPIKIIDFEVKLQLCIASTALTLTLFYLYIKARNSVIFKKINRFLETNEFTACFDYLEKCIRTHPKLFWLKFQKLMLLALKGEITQFKSYLNIIKRDKNIYKNRNLDMIKRFETVFEFITNGKVGEIHDVGIRNSYLEEITYLICNQETISSSEIISIALNIYASPYHLYKSISATILANSYSRLNDLNNANLFKLKAKEFAPSNEILYCVTTMLDDFD